MKTKLLKRLTREAYKLGIRQANWLEEVRKCSLDFGPESTRVSFYSWFGCKLLFIAWHQRDGFCSNIRNKYRKYTRRQHHD